MTCLRQIHRGVAPGEVRASSDVEVMIGGHALVGRAVSYSVTLISHRCEYEQGCLRRNSSGT